MAKLKTDKKGGNMFRFSSYKNFFLMFGKALLPAILLFVVFQTPSFSAQSIVEKAKKEGKVTFYSAMVIKDTQIMGDAFMKKYPFLNFEFVRLPSTRLIQRLIMEKNGGVKKADVAYANGNFTSIYKKEGLAQKYVSPEAKDWPEGYQDPEGYWTAIYSAYFSWAYNTRMVSEQEAPKNSEDLLDPKWKGGKIGIFNVEYEWYQGMMDIMGREKGLQFMKRLAAQELKINSGRTLTTQLMASGEFPIALSAFHRLLQMKKKGAPVQWTSFPTPTLAAMRTLMLHADATHPNAGKLFIDFMLSKQGQNILNSLDRHPIRVDIKVDPVLRGLY
jgi:ABC-type Fe3+ transport system substrate-binding protein